MAKKRKNSGKTDPAPTKGRRKLDGPSVHDDDDDGERSDNGTGVGDAMANSKAHPRSSAPSRSAPSNRAGGGGGGGKPPTRRPADSAPYDDDDDSSSSDDDDDDSLVLEGALFRNPDASDSSDDDDDDDDASLSSEEGDGESEANGSANGTPKRAQSRGGGESKAASAKGRPKQQPKPQHGMAATAEGGGTKGKKKKKKKKKKENEPEIVNVEFQFCDMSEHFFHGVKTLVHSRPVHAPHSSELADLLIENVSVGTVLTTDYDPFAPSPSPDVFGVASVVNLTTNGDAPCVRELKRALLKHCPADRREEMETVLSGGTARPAGFFFQERMVNVPLEIVEVLHKQLVMDMDWAVESVENAGGSEEQRKALDFGAFVRLAPCHREGGGADRRSVVYKYFDDEVFANRAEFVYSFDAPKAGGTTVGAAEEDPLVSVIVMTKTGHRAAMKDLAKMIGGN